MNLLDPILETPPQEGSPTGNYIQQVLQSIVFERILRTPAAYRLDEAIPHNL